MKITLSKSQWESVGKNAGWMKKAQQAPSTAQQIGTAFQGLAGGIAGAGQAKALEYAQRIMKGEKKESVLQGQGQAMIQNVEAALAQLQQTQGQDPAASASSSKTFQIIDQNLKSLEMQSNGLPLNGKQIRVLINQIRQLAQTDPSIAQ